MKWGNGIFILPDIDCRNTMLAPEHVYQILLSMHVHHEHDSTSAAGYLIPVYDILRM